MKKLKIAAVVLIIIISAASVLIVAGRQIMIKNLAKNSKVNDMVQKIETVITDENAKLQLNEFVQQLVNDGVLNEQQIDDYVKVIENEPELSLNVNGKTIGETTSNSAEATVQPKASDKTPKSKTEKILSAMTPSEASFAMSVYSRVSMSEVMSLMKTDKSAAKKYVTDRLSSDEISRALAIYSKYSYLLKE